MVFWPTRLAQILEGTNVIGDHDDEWEFPLHYLERSSEFGLGIDDVLEPGLNASNSEQGIPFELDLRVFFSPICFSNRLLSNVVAVLHNED